VEESASVESGLVQAVVDESLPPRVVVEPVIVKHDPSKTAGDIASQEAVVRENPMNDRAWDSLGHLYRIIQRNNDSINAFEHAIALAPKKYVYHYQLGTLHAAEGNYAAAIVEMEKVIELNPIFLFAHCALASYLRRLGKNEESQLHISIAAPFMAGEKEYDRACFESIRGNIEVALSLLKVALEKKQTTIEWIRRDSDIDFIRRDPRYELFEKQYSQNVIQY
jgi:tetratricopeptide (TPR) repeat protein